MRLDRTTGRPTLIFSATDLSNFLACPHLSLLDGRRAFGGPAPPVFDDPSVEVLRERGLRHEQAYLDRLCEEPGLRVVTVPDPRDEDVAYAERCRRRAGLTIEAMRAGADVIYQGELFSSPWSGRPDFLRRVEVPSRLGDWSYEVVDTKLAREAKGGALLQVLLYAELVAAVQGIVPERVHIALGGPEPRTQTFRVADYAAYFRSVRTRFEQFMRDAPEDLPVAVEPAEHCGLCAWSSMCDGERREADHLSLVAGITRAQRSRLVAVGAATVADLARLELGGGLLRGEIGESAFRRIREQARIQVQGRTTGANLHELLQPVVEGKGLAALPEPSPGDLYFDLEGDPFALGRGLEYLFGFADADGEFTGWWALDAATEKQMFERLIDVVMLRLEQHPDMHIYHYAPYEPSALKRLMGRYATREEEVDRLLRGGVLVDLYRVVKQGLRASVESYSIKRLEPFYGFERAVDLRSASSALAHFEAWLELGGTRDDALLHEIEGYNRDDCISTLRLHGWLERLRGEMADISGADVPRPVAPGAEPLEDAQQRNEEIAALVAALTADLPADDTQHTPEQHGRWVTAHLLEFHRREKKSMWWEYYRCMDLSDEERIEDRATLGGLEYVGEVGVVKRSVVHRYRFLPQDHGLRVDMAPRDPATGKPAGDIVALDDAGGTLDLKRGRTSRVPHPTSLIPFDDVPDTVLRESIRRVGEAVVEHGLTDANPFRCAVDLLLRNGPRVGLAYGPDLLQPGGDVVAAAVRLVASLDHTVLPIQGPPGAGKTYTAARMIVRALELGLRVGVTATSHKVIGNLLDDVCGAARAAGVTISGIQKADDEQRCASSEIEATDSAAEVVSAMQGGRARMAAGTAWLWSRGDMVASVDILFVDEAGQFSLASTIAVAPATRSLVLVGDPQQLEQPIQGVHPPGVDVSALDHLLGATTVAPDRGLFLARTRRLHPDICGFTSELFYDGRLRSLDGLERQALHVGSGRGRLLDGSGLRLITAEHTGNQSGSPEEVEVVAGIVEDLVATRAEWTDQRGERRPLTLADILVVAPYNVQVSALRARLPAGARVGTVDKFQGQEAPLVIYSMTTSSPEDAPRGMAFLYSPNRLNVATSRARCVAAVVASPLLFTPQCRTPEQMRLANAFCRFAELAGGRDRANWGRVAPL